MSEAFSSEKLTTDISVLDEITLEKSKLPKFLRSWSASGTENVHYPLMYDGLTEGDILYAKRELNETEENKVKGIRKLKEYMEKEDLTCSDDRFLVMILRNCKYNIVKSESKLKRFLRVHQLITKKITNMDMGKIEFFLDAFSCGIFTWRDKQGRFIQYSRPNFRLDRYEQEDLVFYVLAQVLFLLQFPLSSIYGMAYIADNKSPTVSYFYILKIAHQLLPLLFDMPLRIARVDVINEHAFSRWVIRMLRPFVPDKVRKRVLCHGSDMGSLNKFYEPEILPDELGGTLGPMSARHYREEFLKFLRRIKEENKNDLHLMLE